MDLGLAGSVALVSGGSKGIGREIALQLAREGVRVVVAARGAAALDQAADEIRAAGGDVRTVTADMTDEADINRVARLALDDFGRIDIAVSNVYPINVDGFEATTDSLFVEEFRTMVMSVVHLTRAVLPDMKRRATGRLINIGSVAMKGPTFGFPQILSHVTRPAVVGLNKSLANELGQYGITVNNIAVGSIKTERARESFQRRTGQTAESFDELEAGRVAELGIPVGRMGVPGDIASLAVFLASPLAGYITGQTISVDGGRTGGLW